MRSQPDTRSRKSAGGSLEQNRPAPSTRAMILTLGGLTAVGPLAIDMYVPAFPEMTVDLSASNSAIQASITTFLLGLIVGQLLIGPASDGLGRRRLLLAGTGGFVVLSVVCALSPTAWVLIIARLLLGLFGAAGLVLSRAVIIDSYEGTAVARNFSVLTVILGVAPVAAPVIGGLIVGFTTWRVVFFVLAAFGLALLGCVIRWVPESLPAARRDPAGITRALTSMRALLTHRTFMGYVLVLATGSASLFAYVAASSFVFQDFYDISVGIYTIIYASNACAALIASSLFGLLARRVRLNTLLSAGVLLSLAATAVLLGIDTATGGVLAASWALLFAAMFGFGLIITGSMALGQTVASDVPGAASAVLGGAQFILGAIISPVLGASGAADPLPMALVMVCGFAAATAALFILARPWHGHGEPTNNPPTGHHHAPTEADAA
jgi:DHA1 family bicyclomycin/chloramphenicol resistance-like MFS transporter